MTSAEKQVLLAELEAIAAEWNNPNPDAGVASKLNRLWDKWQTDPLLDSLKATHIALAVPLTTHAKAIRAKIEHVKTLPTTDPIPTVSFTSQPNPATVNFTVGMPEQKTVVYAVANAVKIEYVAITPLPAGVTAAVTPSQLTLTYDGGPLEGTASGVISAT